MVNYLEILAQWMQQPHYLLLVLIVTYVIAGAVDFIIGTINVSFTKNVEFKTSVAQLGIIRKLVIMVLMILIIPLALILPMDIGVYSLSALYLGIVGSELYSILGHLGLVKDGDKHKNVIGVLFTSILQSVINPKQNKE